MVHGFESIKKGDWVEFEPSFFSIISKHGKIVDYDSTLDAYKVNAQGEYFTVPKKRVKKKLSFAQILFG